MHDLAGQTFGRLKVLWRDTEKSGPHLYWFCRCSCGNTHTAASDKLRLGVTRSCGCYAQECRGKAQITHGETRQPRKNWDPRLKMTYAAKSRAKKMGLPFDLKFTDFEIPSECPVFKFPLNINIGGSARFDSPSLDRVIPHLGYVKGNVQVISHKANTMKSDASLQELKILVAFMESATEVAGGGHHL